MSQPPAANMAPVMAHTKEEVETLRIEPVGTALEELDRVVTAATNYSLRAPHDAPVNLTKTKQMAITALIVTGNLIQFVTMFSTMAAAFKYSEVLGHPAAPGQSNWMAAAYPLTQSSFVLVSGRLGAVFGHKLMLLLGVAIIAVFSLVNAFCPTYESFIAVRALTGIGGGILMPNAVALLTIMVPPGKVRNITLATFAASPPVGAMIGALLAGAFLEKSEWKYFFVLVAIIGAVVFAGLCLVLPTEDIVDKGGKVDWVGIALGVSGLALFNFSWNQAPSVGWQTPYVIATLILSILSILGFLLWEAKFAGASPIMPLSVFAAPTFTALILVVLLTYMAFGMSMWYMVAWQEVTRGWSALHLAVGWIPFAAGASVAVAAAAWLIPRVGARWVLAVGIVSCLASSLLLATQPAQQSYWKQTFPAIVLGSLCPDFTYVAAQIIASNSVGRRNQGVAGSLVGTLNLYGVSLGLGFSGTIEVQVLKNGASEVQGYRAALYFGAALAVAALIMDFAFVRVPKNDGEGWKGEDKEVSDGTATPGEA
ncbi:efflux pump antibiotic resistance protein [Diplodia corticola]|uniref:Efflux pump antibiotic resistance protein n=1 Tax=Diplodia corticola TaxID=236234 RepID=A0A1J9QPB2_9PEZI|nr:efflux pump antibiotic resistance protein [Diplodia corticola]OJD30289.1 efflux pump antibiotic resistance protein [Diplodia corticola]